MADNTTLNAGSGGDVIATDDIGGVKHQRVKVEWGADGSATDTNTGTAALPVQGAAADGAAVAGNPVLNAGQDGTNVQSMLTDTTGRQVVVGAAAGGAAVAGNPLLVAGSDGTLARPLATNTSGALNITTATALPVCGPDAVGGSASYAPVMAAGYDGSAVRRLSVDASGAVVLSSNSGIYSVYARGYDAEGAAVVVAPVRVAGSDGTNVRSLRTDTAGNLYARAAEQATWIVSTGNTAHVAAARTTLLDLFNATGSGVILRVYGVYIIPALAAVTGVGLTYEIIRTSAVGTGGSTATPAAFDASDTSLPAGVTARTKPTGGATTSATLITVNGSSEETLPYANMASILNHVPQGPRLRPLVLRENQGLKIDQTTSSSVGNVNVVVVFTRDSV